MSTSVYRYDIVILEQTLVTIHEEELQMSRLMKVIVMALAILSPHATSGQTAPEAFALNLPSAPTIEVDVRSLIPISISPDAGQGGPTGETWIPKVVLSAPLAEDKMVRWVSNQAITIRADKALVAVAEGVVRVCARLVNKTDQKSAEPQPHPDLRIVVVALEPGGCAIMSAQRNR
jgi:hypothetical protein